MKLNHINNVTLMGLPGAGKSTIGVLLAKTLGKNFIDIDLLIQAGENNTLQQIIEERGIELFCQLERRYALCVRVENTVIAPGGSVIYYPDAMAHFAGLGLIIYLQISLPQLQKRLLNLKTRGVVMSPGQTLADLYHERIGLYEKYAHITVDTTGLDHERTLEAILAGLESFPG